MTTRISNIVLDGNRFLVFYSVDGNEETQTFMPDITADGIKAHIAERVAYYQDLRDKEAEFKETLIDMDL